MSGEAGGEVDRPWVQHAWQQCTAASTKTRTQTVKKCLSAVNDTSNDLSTYDLEQLAFFTFQTLNVYGWRKNRKEVEDLIRALLASPKYAATYTGTFLKLLGQHMGSINDKAGKKPSMRVPRKTQYVLLRWCTIFLAGGLDTLKELKAYPQPFLTVLANLLSGVAEPIARAEGSPVSLPRLTLLAVVRVRKLLATSPDVAEQVVEVISGTTFSPSDPNLRMLCASASSLQPENEKFRTKLIEAYTQLVLLSTSRLSPAELKAFTPLVASFTEEEKKQVVAQLVKAVRRNPGLAMGPAVHFLRHVKEPVDAIVKEVLLSAASSLSADDALLRNDVRNLISASLDRLQDAAVIESTVQQVVAGVTDRKASPKAKLETIKFATELASRSFVSKLSGASISKQVSGILKGVRGAANDSERLAVLIALGTWTKALGEAEVPKDIVNLYATGIKNMQQRSMYLASLAIAAESHGKELNTLCPSLAEIVKKSATAHSKNFDRVAAFASIFLLDGADGDTTKSLAEVLFKADSFLFSFDFIDAMGQHQTRVVSNLARGVIAEGPSWIQAGGDAAVLPYRLLARVLAVKDATRATVAAAIGEKAKASASTGDFLANLTSSLLWLTKELEQDLAAAGSKNTRKVASALSSSVRTIYNGIVTADAAPIFMQLVAQPVISPNVETAFGLFDSGTGGEVKELSALQRDEVSSALFAALSQKGSQYQQRAGQTTLSLLAYVIGDGVRSIASRLLAQMTEANIQLLTDEQLDLYFTPEGELYDTSVAGTTYQSRSKAKTEDDDDLDLRSSKGRAPSKGKGKGKGKGKAKSNAGPTKEELIQKAVDAKLEEESAVRNSIRLSINAVLQALSGFRAIAVVPSAMKEIVPMIFEAIFGLLTHRVVHKEVFATLTTLSASAGLPSLAFASTVLQLQNRIYGRDKELFTHMDVAEPVAKSFKKIDGLSVSGKMTSAGLFFCGPLLDYCIRCPTSFKMQDQGITLVERHAKQSQPRARFLAALMFIIDTAPRQAERCSDVITKVSRSICSRRPLSVLFGLGGARSKNATVRHAAVLGLGAAASFLKEDIDIGSTETSSFLWFTRSDPKEPVAASAVKAWDAVGAAVPENLSLLLSELYAAETDSHLPLQFARALASAGEHHQEQGNDEVGVSLLKELQDQYESFLPAAPIITPRGYEYAEDLHFNARRSIAVALGECAPLIQGVDGISEIFTFLSTKGPLIDGQEDVRQAMTDAGSSIVVHHGAEFASEILALLEDSLKESDTAVTGALLREAFVVFMGGLAKYFKAGDPNVLVIIDRLLETLNTPSERVQLAISNCLSPLMKLAKSEDERVLNLLFDRIAKSDSHDVHVRNGAAYGIAGAIKGLGNVSFKKHGILDRLKVMLADKKSFQNREGALMTVEYLAKRLQRLFEPYTVQLIDPLLQCYGDSSPDIRDRTDHTAKAIMSTLRPSGVSFILPGIIAGLNAVSWRPKKAAVELLGSMAFCAPKQLGMCLPQIVPPLLTVLSDSHEKVQLSGRRALGHIASVIRNPEIQVHIPSLLKALNNPEKYSATALDALINTNFVHVIDAPSLALIMPLLERSLRSTDMAVKRKAARIAGHMTSLADHKALCPYLNILLPNIKATLVDASPETRSVSAVALGHLVHGLGEEKFPGIMKWLNSEMVSEESTVVRSGAAQGLSQVVGMMPEERFDALLPKILVSAKSHKPAEREGSIGFFMYVPTSMGVKMEKYLPRILPVVLHGLADESESVRDIAVRSTQAIVAQFAMSSLDTLLPCLEDGLFDSNWRIRQSSVHLMGDLLFKITGDDRSVPDVATHNDDDGVLHASESLIVDALGEKRYCQVLSSLYIIRSDVNNVVRQQALLVWKSVVDNTPKTLERILGVLMGMIIRCLGSDSEERRLGSSRTLGELVRKLGEKILPSIIPILESGLATGDSATRQGVCLGLTEVLESAPRRQLENYLPDIIPTVQKALADPLPEVREAAAQAFDTLYRSAGSVVVDNAVPSILKNLEKEETAADGINALKEVLGVRSKKILPLLLPSLLEKPLTQAKCDALVTVAEESGSAIYRHLTTILKKLVGTVASDELALRAASAVVVAVEEDGMHILLADLLGFTKDKDSVEVRKGAAVLIKELCLNSSLDAGQTTTQLLQALIFGLMDDDEECLKLYSAALSSCVKSIPKEKQGAYLADIRRHLRYCRAQLEPLGHTLLPGFCLPNGTGVAPLLPVFLAGLRSPSSDVRENAALGLGDIINLASKAALQKQLRLVIGGLIRGVGDRFPGNVKAAILRTMGQVLDKSEVATIKSFMVMMQTTFIKNLNDPSEQVREHAGNNLGKLINLGTKVDPLVNELLNGVTNAQDEYKQTMVRALYNVMRQETQLGDRILANAEKKLFQLLDHDDQAVRNITAKAIGAFSKLAPADQFARVVETVVAIDDPATGALVFSQVMAHAADKVTDNYDSLQAHLVGLLTHSSHDAQICALLSVSAIVSSNAAFWQAIEPTIVPLLTTELLANGSSDVRIQTLKALKTYAKKHPEDMKKQLPMVVPELMVRVKDRTALPVKLAAERTLLHALQVKSDPSVLKELLETADYPAAQANGIRDYCKRILSKLPADSDDE